MRYPVEMEELVVVHDVDSLVKEDSLCEALKFYLLLLLAQDAHLSKKFPVGNDL